MNIMKQDTHTEVFEQVLLSYVEMCYAVALALTHDQDNAHHLTREVFLDAWHLRNTEDAVTNIKSNLLITMRKHFTENYWQPSQKRGRAPAIMERS